MERKSWTSELHVKNLKRFTERLILTTSLLGVGFLFTPGVVSAQAGESEKPPVPPIINPNPFRNVGIKPVFQMREPVDLRFYDGCEVTNQSWEGLATHYYPGDGCQGCSENNLTAMGVPLNYHDRTLAFMDAPLGTEVKIVNLDNGLTTRSVVNDRGGFKAHGFIADLSPATRTALEAEDISEVRISVLQNCRR